METNYLDLNQNEKLILKYIGMGKTSKDIAIKLNLSKKTIEKYRSDLRVKFESSNTAEMMVKATEMGFLR